MLADSETAAGPTAEFVTLGVAIIPEVLLVGKELVFVVEIDLIQPNIIVSEPETPELDIITGVFAVTEASDIFEAFAADVIQGSMAVTEASADVLAATGNVLVEGALAVTEAADTFAAVGQSYTANPVAFDGTNDYLNLLAVLSGVADSKLVTGSLWIRWLGSGAQNIIWERNEEFRVFTSPTVAGAVEITAENAVGTTILRIRSSAVLNDSAWHHVAFSFDLGDVAKRHLYIDGVSDLSVVTYNTAETINLNNNLWGIGATSGGNSIYHGDLAEVQLWFGHYLDLSQATNRALFYSGGGSPVDPSAAAASALGVADILLSGPTATWHTNDGSGGGFTENGALTDGGTPLP